MSKKGVFTKDYLLTDDEITKLKESATDLKERIVILGMLNTGMRVSEFIHMRRDWITSSPLAIKIPTEQPCDCHDCVKTHKGVWKPKTKEAIRQIPMFPALFPELKKAFAEYFSSHNTIMETINSRPAVWYVIEKVRKRAGIEHKVFPQVFRATYAQQLIKSKIDAYCIKGIMGWKVISIPQGDARTEGDIKKEIEKKLKPF